jgi:hypothetical protein
MEIQRSWAITAHCIRQHLHVVDDLRPSQQPGVSAQTQVTAHKLQHGTNPNSGLPDRNSGRSEQTRFPAHAHSSLYMGHGKSTLYTSVALRLPDYSSQQTPVQYAKALTGSPNRCLLCTSGRLSTIYISFRSVQRTPISLSSFSKNVSVPPNPWDMELRPIFCRNPPGYITCIRVSRTNLSDCDELVVVPYSMLISSMCLCRSPHQFDSSTLSARIPDPIRHLSDISAGSQLPWQPIPVLDPLSGNKYAQSIATSPWSWLTILTGFPGFPRHGHPPREPRLPPRACSPAGWLFGAPKSTFLTSNRPPEAISDRCLRGSQNGMSRMRWRCRGRGLRACACGLLAAAGSCRRPSSTTAGGKKIEKLGSAGEMPCQLLLRSSYDRTIVPRTSYLEIPRTRTPYADGSTAYVRSVGSYRPWLRTWP